MTPRNRRLVRARADSRCEYFAFHEQDLPFWLFHLDHIIAGQHSGTNDMENLAWGLSTLQPFQSNESERCGSGLNAGGAPVQSAH